MIKACCCLKVEKLKGLAKLGKNKTDAGIFFTCCHTCHTSCADEGRNLMCHTS